jgi:hypothetical protein
VLACAVLAAVLVGAGVYMVRQTFPSSGTASEAATCTILRFAIGFAENALEQGGSSGPEQAQLRRSLQDMRAQYQQSCGPLP